jgi:hypothetical protein
MGLRGAGLGSSGIGASLHRLVTIIPWHPRASGSWPSYRRGPGKLSGHRHPAATAPPSLRVFPASRCVKSSPDATTQAGWLAPGDSTNGAETVPRALCGLGVLAANDSAAVAAVQADLRADPSSAAAVALLLNGYTEGRRWYADPVGFFLAEPWAAQGGAGRSIGDLVRDDWSRVRPLSPGAPTPSPGFQTQLFGYPQAVPHYKRPAGAVQPSGERRQ